MGTTQESKMGPLEKALGVPDPDLQQKIQCPSFQSPALLKPRASFQRILPRCSEGINFQVRAVQPRRG